jgi:Family of unknown function (DUF5906)
MTEAHQKIAEIIDAAPIVDIARPLEIAEGPTPAGQRPKKARTPSSRSAEHDELGTPRARGFDVNRLNSEFALVLMGSKAVVFLEQPKVRLVEDEKRILTLEAFNAWFRNRWTEIKGPDGRVKAVTWAAAWLQAENRRSYRGIEFYPDANNAPGTPQYHNLWSGFAVKPASEPDWRKYKTFRDHLLNNVCSGDERLFRWVFGFFAHIVQKPRDRLGVALVLRGRMGTGKTKVGEIIGSVFPRHYFLVDDPRYVTGQFNAHMASCLLLQADEAVWAGDKAAEGRLKGLVTAPVQQIEHKGVDPIRLPNYVRLIMTSNEDWVVPAGKDERRFCVLDVDPRCMQNHEYFREMDEELEATGLEHLLGDLLAFDLDSVDLWQIPQTRALLEQKIRSLESVESWWFERLMSGTTGRHSPNWREEIPIQTLFDDYIAVSDKIGIKRKREETVFGMTLAKLLPGGVRTAKRTTLIRDDDGHEVQKRMRCYLLPPLKVAREHFAIIVNQSVDWPGDDADDGSREGPENRG